MRIALDDFGTGYASLSLLQRFPLDRLKIDKGFVARIDEDAGAAEIVQAVIGIARTYGLGVIAEGVETKAQELTLRALGCAEAQGFRYGRPMPTAELLDAWRNPPAPSKTAARA
ncbi:EAL domain-containing protein [Novosphingobium aerophilum]|uniref:EAL domain-containing protein n=1 Tax=Novosphingobium aerophilum TaxID=2839843 RepID=A0A7X1KAH7_9SPHN|nr:EAL domain-containing protein [Novosphingobium aerophilum]MBC2650211.1 EAL domain-containing protein [Novosphingobium aerophilum]